jgi:hypothetical protein
MIAPSYAQKHFASARCRFLRPALINFLATELPKAMGPLLREKFTDQLIALFESLCPEVKHLKPGQLLWNALDKETRGDSPNRRFVPVVLTLINEEDVQQLTNGISMLQIAQNSIARMTLEAFDQGGVLSTRDIGLLILKSPSVSSRLRRSYEATQDKPLPHTGIIHDMGTSITHKEMIVRKVVLEKKDPARVAQECMHSQRAVDRYLKDYHRVKTLHLDGKDDIFIHRVTAIAVHVVRQYLAIIRKESNP